MSTSGGSGGSSVTFGPLVNGAVSDAPVVIPCDSGNHSVKCIVAMPPSWLDTAGAIIAPGLYGVSIRIQIDTPPTLNGLFVNVSYGPFVDQVLSLDLLGVFPGQTVIAQSAVGTVDVPYTPLFVVNPQTDITGVISATMAIGQLAHN